MAHPKIVEITDAINLSLNEKVLKTYEAFELIEPSGNGIFSVTNQRLLFAATGSSGATSSVTITEWLLSDIKGIQSEYGKRRHRKQTSIANVIGILSALVFIFLGMLYFSGREVQTLYILGGGFLLLLFIVLRLTAKRKIFSLVVLGGVSYPIIQLSSTFYKSAVLSQIQIKPSKFTTVMIKTWVNNTKCEGLER